MQYLSAIFRKIIILFFKNLTHHEPATPWKKASWQRHQTHNMMLQRRQSLQRSVSCTGLTTPKRRPREVKGRSFPIRTAPSSIFYFLEDLQVLSKWLHLPFPDQTNKQPTFKGSLSITRRQTFQSVNDLRLKSG